MWLVALQDRQVLRPPQQLLSGKPVSVPETDNAGCIIGRLSKVEPHGEVTYANQISRIFQKHCVDCHRAGEIGPFPMTTYDEVLGWGEMIQEVVEERRMPPWYANPEHGQFKNERRLSAEERQLVLQWVANGQPFGKESDLPEQPVFTSGWQIPAPDVVLYASETPFLIPAQGIVRLIYCTVDTGFTEDKWITAAQVRPGNRAVVHHIICSVVPPNEMGPGAVFPRQGNFVGYAPGQMARIYPKDQAYLIPAGSKITFQIHYTPIGIATEDRSCIGLVFGKQEDVKFVSKGGVCGTEDFKIPAGATDHVIKGKRRIHSDVYITGMIPHAHVRCKSFRYEVDFPDGTNEVLLDVPHYDFNWQLYYELATPKLLPKGAVLRTTAHYDNSSDNAYNPDPTIDVVFGEQTWDEMMYGWYLTVVPRAEIDANKLPPPPPPVKLSE